MSSELAYTVHHKGRKYRAGLTAEEIGPVAANFGDHVWKDGKVPAKTSIPDQGSPDGGTLLGTPPVPPPSGLPGPNTSADIAATTRTEAPPPAPTAESGGDVESGPAPRRTGGGRRG